MKLQHLSLLAAAISCLFLVTGCIVQERSAPPHAVYVQSPPPADIVEMQPPPPDNSPYWAWQKGHWRWNGTRYYWTSGHWVSRPPHYSVWVPPHWDVRGNGWIFVEGHWQ